MTLKAKYLIPFIGIHLEILIHGAYLHTGLFCGARSSVFNYDNQRPILR